MIDHLKIQNYKSIQLLDIPCKKVNVFIGEPNSGKSNIIEAVSLLSQNILTDKNFKEIIRNNNIGDLFFDMDITTPITIQTNEIEAELIYKKNEDGTTHNQFTLNINNIKTGSQTVVYIYHDGTINNTSGIITTPIRYYQYKRMIDFMGHYLTHLNPPYGDNLPIVLLNNKKIKNWVSDFFAEKEFILQLNPVKNEIQMTKSVDNVLYSHPYIVISETVQRIIFYIVAMDSNQNKTMLFDEPETNTFPFYTKFLAERIALDETNQFFLTTHNPYLLLSLIEKSKSEDINVFVTKMKDYKTEVTLLNPEQVSELLEYNSDAFFNLDNITA